MSHSWIPFSYQCLLINDLEMIYLAARAATLLMQKLYPVWRIIA
jgi:hypothetical protein